MSSSFTLIERGVVKTMFSLVMEVVLQHTVLAKTNGDILGKAYPEQELFIDLHDFVQGLI